MNDEDRAVTDTVQGGDKSAVESNLLPFGIEAFLPVFRTIVRTVHVVTALKSW
jgi:hypothetical protein